MLKRIGRYEFEPTGRGHLFCFFPRRGEHGAHKSYNVVPVGVIEPRCQKWLWELSDKTDIGLASTEEQAQRDLVRAYKDANGN